MKIFRTERQLRCVLVPAVGIALCFAAAGCGREPSKFLVYDKGKINLDRVTSISPVIKIGIDEFPLDRENIEKVAGLLSEGKYTYFHVQALIRFDELTWTVYKSDSFDTTKNSLSEKDIAKIRKALTRAMNTYRKIR